MNAWLLLAIAIIAEIIGTSCLKASNGFNNPLPSIIAIIAFTIALYLVSIVTRTLPLGIVYAIWSGVGIILTSCIAFLVFGQKPNLAEIIGMILIVCGVLVIHLFSS